MSSAASSTPASTPERDVDALPPLKPLSLAAQRAQHRVVSAAFFCTTVALLATAAWLTPASRGMGTHQGLGLPPCGFETATGMPCMTCGMTTAFAHAADGHFIASFRTQPMGAVLAVFTAVMALVSGYTLVTGISLAPLGRLFWRPVPITVFVVAMALAWGYKIVISYG